jgi:hypothetical protein
MVPVLIGLGIAAAVAGLTALVIHFLGWDKVLDWFRGRQKLVQADRDNIAFTLHNALESGNHGVVQGIFNKRTNELVSADAGQKYEAEEIDEQLQEIHKDNEVVIYS